MVHILLVFLHIIEWLGFGFGISLILLSSVTPWKDNAMPIGSMLFLVGTVLAGILGLILFLTGGF